MARIIKRWVNPDGSGGITTFAHSVGGMRAFWFHDNNLVVLDSPAMDEIYRKVDAQLAKKRRRKPVERRQA